MDPGTDKRRRGVTMDALRDSIDRGETGDKVPASDPAAAPLGTDDEAAGAPPDPKLVAEVQARETSRPAPSEGWAPYEAEGGPGTGVAIFLLAVVALGGSIAGLIRASG